MSEVKTPYMPMEILAAIAEQIHDTTTLKDFALVSKRCCAIARQHLFKEITMDYSPRSWHLLKAILQESGSSISWCIQDLSLSIKFEYLDGGHMCGLALMHHMLTQSEKTDLDGYCRYFDGIAELIRGRLPRLKTFNWRDTHKLSSRIWEKYLPKFVAEDQLIKLHTLQINPDISETSSEFFEGLGKISSLETLILTPNKNNKHSGLLALLRNNPQLRKVQLPQPCETEVLEQEILPIFANQFSRLECLSSVWDSEHIPKTSLVLISKISSLTKLYMSVSKPYGEDNQWLVDHKMIKNILRPLKNLQLLAFSHDTYDPGLCRLCNIALQHPQHYYNTFMLTSHIRTQDEDVNQSDKVLGQVSQSVNRLELWEEQHRDRMFWQAKEYFIRLPALEHIFIGQLHVLCSKDRQCISFSGERGDGFHFLKKIFG